MNSRVLFCFLLFALLAALLPGTEADRSKFVKTRGTKTPSSLAAAEEGPAGRSVKGQGQGGRSTKGQGQGGRSMKGSSKGAGQGGRGLKGQSGRGGPKRGEERV